MSCAEEGGKIRRNRVRSEWEDWAAWKREDDRGGEGGWHTVPERRGGTAEGKMVLFSIIFRCEEKRVGGETPPPPPSPSGGCCARHPAGLWRTVAFGSQHAGTGGCLHNMTSESGAVEARAAERSGREERLTRVGRGAGRVRRGGGGGYMSTHRVASTCTSGTHTAERKAAPCAELLLGERSGWDERGAAG